VYGTGVRRRPTRNHGRQNESVVEQGDESSEAADSLWLEFDELTPTTAFCRSVSAGDDQARQSRLVVYLRGNDADTGKCVPFRLLL